MKKLVIGMFLSLLSTAAFAVPVTSLVGDKDCFGTYDVCAETGSWLPAGWGISAEGDDPTFTDRGISTSSTTSWEHSIAAGSYSSATLTIRTLGIADIYGPYGVYVDGILAGFMPYDGTGHILVETFTFSFDASVLTDGLALVSFTSVAGDLWAIDYSEIVAEASIPVPSVLALLGLGLVAMGFSRRKRSA